MTLHKSNYKKSQKIINFNGKNKKIKANQQVINEFTVFKDHQHNNRKNSKKTLRQVEWIRLFLKT